MEFSFKEFLLETYPILGAGIGVWLVVRWAGGPSLVAGRLAVVYAAIAALLAAYMTLPGTIKRMKETKHA